MFHDEDSEYIVSPYVTKKYFSYITPFHTTNESTFHIFLCQELIQRYEFDKEIFTFDEFGIGEDEDLYRNYDSPNVNRIEMFSIILMIHTDKEYDMKYKHNCAYSNYNRDQNQEDQ